MAKNGPASRPNGIQKEHIDVTRMNLYKDRSIFNLLFENNSILNAEYLEKTTHLFMHNRTDLLHQLMSLYSVPGLASVWLEGGKEPTKICLGTPRQGSPSRVDRNTFFQIASLSKVVFARLCYELSQKNLVDLDEDISDDFKDFGIELHGKNVSIRTLLTHTAGFNTRGFRGVDFKKSPVEKRDYFNHLNLENPICLLPELWGTYSYSGGGYFLLELILEKKFKCSIQSLMNEIDFPIKNLILADIPQDVQLAASHYPQAGSEKADIHFHEFRTQPSKSAAGMWGNAETLESIIQHSLELFRQNPSLFLPHNPSPHCVLGFRSDFRNGAVFLRHTEENRGYISAIYINHSAQKAVAIVTNSSSGESLIADVGKILKNVKFFS